MRRSISSGAVGKNPLLGPGLGVYGTVPLALTVGSEHILNLSDSWRGGWCSHCCLGGQETPEPTRGGRTDLPVIPDTIQCIRGHCGIFMSGDMITLSSWY